MLRMSACSSQNIGTDAHKYSTKCGALHLLSLSTYLFINFLRVLLVFTTVMSRQVFAAQEVTTFSRGLVTGWGGSVPLCFKIKLSVMRLKVPCVLCVTTKLFRPTKSQTAEGMAFGPQLTPLRSALFHTGDGTVRVRHHIATLEHNLTRKEFRLIYMWTGF